jgi:outer membrane protein insertion porin family
MKKFSFVFGVAVILVGASNLLAQASPGNVSTPCVDQPTIGRRVLQNRQASSEARSTPESSNPGSTSPLCENHAITTPQPPELRFEGLTAIAESELRVALLQRLTPSAVAFADAAELEKAEAVIRDVLADYGYRHAQVFSRLDRRNAKRVVTFVISEGPRFTVSEIIFEGNRIFPQQLLVARVKDCTAGFQNSDSSIFHSDIFAYCLQHVASFERSRGYLQARFGEPTIEEVGEGLVIRVQSDEAALYRLGRIEIVGADYVAEANIRTMVDMCSGDIANGEKIAKTFFEDLKAVYGEKGFIQYTAEIDPSFYRAPDAAEGVVDLKITIEEGPRFMIRKISFRGDSLPDNELRQLFVLHGGDIYNQKLFEESIQRINETGSFNFVDKDKDVDFRTNEEERLVDVVIKLTKRNS